MSLTKCPACHHLTFISAASCPGCGEGFPAGTLQTKSDKEDKAFTRRWGALFLSVLFCMVAALIFAMLRK
jgi:hypothetical protein